MAPTTRSKAANTGNVPAVAPAPAPPPPRKPAGGRTKKVKPMKRPAAAAAVTPKAAPSKVQKKTKKKSSPKGKKGKGKGKAIFSSAETSAKSSSKASSSKASSSNASSQAPFTKPTRKTPRPAAASTTVQDDFPELAQVLPFVDQNDLQPSSASRSPNRRPERFFTPPEYPRHSPGRPTSLFPGLEPTSSGSSGGSDRPRNLYVEDQSGEEEESETPVEVRNSHVFKRPTVKDVRRERTLIHDEMREWVARMKVARSEFDEVIAEMEDRMKVIKAVNRMQAPLRKARLGRGR